MSGRPRDRLGKRSGENFHYCFFVFFMFTMKREMPEAAPGEAKLRYTYDTTFVWFT